jgi:hypothetical protein
MVLALCLGLAVAGALVLAVRHEIRAACVGLTLSNGTEVLVSPTEYERVVAVYRTSCAAAADDGADVGRLWDEVVLGVLRPTRPNECRYLARTLNADAARASEPSVWRRGQFALL